MCCIHLCSWMLILQAFMQSIIDRPLRVFLLNTTCFEVQGSSIISVSKWRPSWDIDSDLVLPYFFLLFPLGKAFTIQHPQIYYRIFFNLLYLCEQLIMQMTPFCLTLLLLDCPSETCFRGKPCVYIILCLNYMSTFTWVFFSPFLSIPPFFPAGRSLHALAMRCVHLVVEKKRRKKKRKLILSQGRPCRCTLDVEWKGEFCIFQFALWVVCINS